MTLISLKYEIIDILVSVGNVLHVPAFFVMFVSYSKTSSKGLCVKELDGHYNYPISPSDCGDRNTAPPAKESPSLGG